MIGDHYYMATPGEETDKPFDWHPQWGRQVLGNLLNQEWGFPQYLHGTFRRCDMKSNMQNS